MDKIFLGTGAKGEGRLYLEKHQWDCGWYWGFGYIGNAGVHTHIEFLIKRREKYDRYWVDVSHQFKSTWITQDQWWILRDLFISAYAFKRAAEVYRYGGHQTEAANTFRILNSERAADINRDLEVLLERIWILLTEWKQAAE